MKEALYQTFEDLLSDLNSREIDIIKRRFGIDREKKESLGRIGMDFGLTRERIRQIQDAILGKIKAKFSSTPFIKKIYEETEVYIGSLPVKREIYILENFSNNYSLEDNDKKILRLFLIILPDYLYHKETKIYHSFLGKENIFKEALSLLNNLHSTLSKKIFTEEEFLNFLEDNVKRIINVSPDVNELYEFAKILKKLGKNPLNEVGSIDHKRISPSSLIDKIYLVFKLEKKPMHFTEVYEKLNKIKEIEDDLISDRWKKDYSLQSVLNTLISSDKFAWYGRGKYALKEDGYKDGNIIELMKEIVKKHNGIKANRLLELVSKQKAVSKNTFSVYLQKYFKKIDNRVYLK
jgi:hypothetical protein